MATIFLLLALLLKAMPLSSQDDRMTSLTTTIDVLPAQLLSRPSATNWLSYNGDYTGRRYSALREVHAGNVAQLRAQWVFHASSYSNLEVTPVVVDGIMFVTAANDAYALDAQTGRTIWHYSRPITEGLIDDASQHHNRGVGIWRSRIYMETDNAHLLCLDARSGHLLWDVAYTDGNPNYGATSAPLVVQNKVIVGTSGGDDGVRGFVAAYDAESGKEVWRFWTIPGPGEFGSASWPGESYKLGGGTTWMPGTFDPELNTIFWGTSNPAPDFDGAPRPGYDLYTDCLLALDPDTGKLKWYFQFTPHDLFDYDATETPVLIDAAYTGESRKLVVQANRNGYIYILDRTSGEFLSAIRFVEKLNWANGIDAKGRPIRSDIMPTPSGTKVCPGYAGATNWFSPSYSETSHLFYVLAREQCQTYFSAAEPQQFQPGKEFYSTGVKHAAGEKSEKILMAFDVSSATFLWKYPQICYGHSMSGTMATAGGLLFFGNDAQSFEAVEAQNGKPLWHFNTGQDMSVSPITYAV